MSRLFIFCLIFELTHLNLLTWGIKRSFRKDALYIKKNVGGSNDHGRKNLCRKWGVFLEKIEDQEMTVESLATLIIKDPKGETVEIGDPERKGENPINYGYRVEFRAVPFY